MKHLLADGCNLVAAIFSAFASYYWYRASTVKTPPEALPGISVWGTYAEPKPNVSVDTRPLVKFVNDSSKANKTAAKWSAAAALAWALSGTAAFLP